jgi:hypothetical protein
MDPAGEQVIGGGIRADFVVFPGGGGSPAVQNRGLDIHQQQAETASLVTNSLFNIHFADGTAWKLTIKWNMYVPLPSWQIFHKRTRRWKYGWLSLIEIYQRLFAINKNTKSTKRYNIKRLLKDSVATNVFHLGPQTYRLGQN